MTRWLDDVGSAAGQHAQDVLEVWSDADPHWEVYSKYYDCKRHQEPLTCVKTFVVPVVRDWMSDYWSGILKTVGGRVTGADFKTLEKTLALDNLRNMPRLGVRIFDRVSSPARYPRFEPEKMHPKSVETVTKADGTVKHRETTDYGAWRVKAWRLWREWRLRVMVRKAEDRRRCPNVRRFATKGQPGPESFNAGLQSERVGDLRWGSVFTFAESVDILKMCRLH